MTQLTPKELWRLSALLEVLSHAGHIDEAELVDLLGEPTDHPHSEESFYIWKAS